MKISYGITVCDEVQELTTLLNSLTLSIRPEDEVVVLVDDSRGKHEDLVNLCNALFSNVPYSTKVFVDTFQGHFGNWKNLLDSKCTGDYIFQIDADEIPNSELIKILPTVLEKNDVDVIAVPRENRVEGLQKEDITRWHWRVTSDGLVNWPDYQWRIYRNVPEIEWDGKVHEHPVGFKKYAYLPEETKYCLKHYKPIDRQKAQNSLYDRLSNEREITAVLGANKNLRLTQQFYEKFRAHFPEQPLVVSALGASEDIISFLKSLNDPNLKVVYGNREGTISFSEVYNAGINAVDTEKLVLIHNDMVFAPDFFKKLNEHILPNQFSGYTTIEPVFPNTFQDPKPGKIVKDFGTSFENFQELSFLGYCGSFHQKYSGEKCSHTFFLAGYKDLFEKVGGFDQNTYTCFCEDDDFCLRAKQKNYPIRLNNQAKSYHFVSKTSRSQENAKNLEQDSLKKFYRKWGIYPRDFWMTAQLPDKEDLTNYLLLQRNTKYSL